LDEDYTANELSILAEHITDSGIVDMAFQRNPDPILWLVRDDGTLLSMTYDPKQDVVAWARHYAGSSSTTSESRATVNAQYPLLRTTTDQDDLQLPAVTAVNNFEDLQAMSATGNYYLTVDIDASTSEFTPIGTSGTPFTGTFDGKGYTITGLNIDRQTTDRNGLFGQVDGPARIANVTLADVVIAGETNTGALVGETKPSSGNNITIQNCHSSGTISRSAGTIETGYGGLIGSCSPNSAAGTTFVYDCSSSCTIDGTPGSQSRDMGGLIGSSRRATISNCFATGDVTESPTNAGDRHGGLIGQAGAATVITYCYATGNVTCSLECGGLVGAAESTATIDKSYATGNVTGTNQEIGGLVGDNNANITDCYAWGTATGTGGSSLDIGGCVGVGTTATDTYKQIYCIGAATGDSVVGGFAGSGAGVGTDIYWDTEASGNATSDGDLEEVGHTTTWLKTQSNYPSTWDFDTIWYMQPLVQETVQSVRVESVAVIPSTAEDEVWVTCNRTINGSTVRYIERMKPRDWGDDMEDMFFVDSGLTYDGDSTSTITGLDHLEGETVAILADGAVQPSKTVSSGAITLTDAASVVQVGIPYTYKLKPMRMDQNTQQGTSKGSVKKITEAVISFYKTLNARYGDGTDTYDINWRETSAEYTTPPDLVTGDKVVVADGGFSVEDPFQIEGSDPMPCSIRAIIPRIEQTGR
jgi:hypothetical protein